MRILTFSAANQYKNKADLSKGGLDAPVVQLSWEDGVLAGTTISTVVSTAVDSDNVLVTSDCVLSTTNSGTLTTIICKTFGTSGTGAATDGDQFRMRVTATLSNAAVLIYDLFWAIVSPTYAPFPPTYIPVPSGNQTITGDLAVSGNFTVGGTTILSGAVSALTTLAVAGASTLTGNVAALGTLAVTGTSTLTGNVTALGTLAVTGTVTGSSTGQFLRMGVGVAPDGTAAVNVAGLVQPSTDNTRDFGTAALRWANGFFSTALVVGTNPASAGAVRLANNAPIRGRNAANSGDVFLISANTSDLVAIGNGTAGVVVGASILPAADNAYNIGTGALRFGGGFFAGTLQFGTYTAVAGAITGYITITDAAGNSRKLAVTT